MCDTGRQARRILTKKNQIQFTCKMPGTSGHEILQVFTTMVVKGAQCTSTVVLGGGRGM